MNSKLLTTILEVKDKRELLASYDESDIYEGALEDAKERLRDGWEGTEEELEKEAQEQASQDSDYFSMAFDDFRDGLKEIFKGYYHIEGKNLGWQNRSGHKDAEINGWDDLRDKVLPKTSELTIKIYKGNKDGEIEMTVAHHDAPMGENYYFTPISEDEFNKEGE